ncbi:hypothetical protein M9Y10_010375 [Tritrichomonas musculus]|uniref:Myb-like DNA-binding domain containing protein n=1 Tax=Tritrichomonas musculus TaxID=1915356 RepID=A0ABR2ILR2_9EUKA
MQAERKLRYYKKSMIKHFTPTEDQVILSLAKPDGENDWCKISKSLKHRTARQCRDRWNNYLDPNLNRNEWTNEEDELLLKLFNEKGPQWRSFTVVLNGRSINDVRNRCFKLIRKKEKLLRNSNKKKSIPKSDEVKLLPSSFSIPNTNLEMNIFDNDILSNFEGFSFDTDELFEAFE